jgi:carbon-monoxide dehydrogenase small subunit
MTGRTDIVVTVNGTRRSAQVEPRRLLADLLREDFGLTGTHLSCEIGVCGVCTVLMNGESVRSCLVLAAQADGAEIVTVEGLASGEELTPLQGAFWEHHGLQCGFCTPGFLMTLHGLFRNKPDASDDEIRERLDDVLCRCTGYQNIFKAAVAARDKLKPAR